MKRLIKHNKYLENFARKLYSFIPYEKRKLDDEFYKFYNLLQENEKKSFDEIKEYQFKKLKEMVNIAYYHTAFYREKYNQAQFNPDDLKTLADTFGWDESVFFKDASLLPEHEQILEILCRITDKKTLEAIKQIISRMVL